MTKERCPQCGYEEPKRKTPCESEFALHMPFYDEKGKLRGHMSLIKYRIVIYEKEDC